MPMVVILHVKSYFPISVLFARIASLQYITAKQLKVAYPKPL